MFDRLSIVVSSFEDLDFVVVCSVHEPVFIVDPPGPVTGQSPLERFWLSNPGKRVALDFSNESGDPSGHLAIAGQPEQEVLPGIGIEVDASHPWPPAISSRSSIDFVYVAGAGWPALSRATASMSRRAFSGERSR
jgi:hypothetical protein